MTTQLHPAWRSQAHQRGIALVVALILLVIATLSGIAGIRNTTLQETMTGNFYDRSLAMQAAEAGIVAALAALSEDVPTIVGIDTSRSIGCHPTGRRFLRTSSDTGPRTPSTPMSISCEAALPASALRGPATPAGAG